MYMNKQERGITGPQRGSQRNEASASMAEKLQGVCLLSSHQLGTLGGSFTRAVNLVRVPLLGCSSFTGHISVGLHRCGKSLVSTLMEVAPVASGDLRSLAGVHGWTPNISTKDISWRGEICGSSRSDSGCAWHQTGTAFLNGVFPSSMTGCH